MTIPVITQINCPELKLFKKGKVRSVYDFGDKLLIVASDRISAFDFILPTGIPNKASVLTDLSKYWFSYTKDIVKNHFLTSNVDEFPEEAKQYRDILEGRSMLVKKTELIPIECVVRGYIVGSGWKEYLEKGTVCDIKLPKGLEQAAKLEAPLFTPAFKAEEGEHDENISFKRMKELVGEDLSEKLSKISLDLYNKVTEYTSKRGIILADTKFEFGLLDGEVILIDECFTPDSSRFWDASTYRTGISPDSFDKQIVRDHLENSDWNKQAPAPNLPQEIIDKASSRYIEVKDKLIEK
ncbi:phosphoribosylaminoimidazolesuccinocarboxamide synthase [Candidatus Marinamargulisbacteria bacterium SCGC AAA071-K20]|nr:phosphoribosylaminoimidazolesuccinocarboxamide synthase [Candidatus Marinamargulisbacteria bacterium SCGC AAA071-K20]